MKRPENMRVAIRQAQPMSLIKDVEPDIEVFDLLVSQQQVEELDFETVDAQELAVDIKDILVATSPRYRRYVDVEPTDVSKFTIEYDNYPQPILGPEKGIQVLVCFAKTWSKDWGGEVIAFEECEPSEVISSFPGRILVANTQAWWKVSQPNVRAEDKLNYLFFTLEN